MPNGSDSKMIHLPGGVLIRGSTEFPDEGPITRVRLSPFAMGRTPVTNAEYRKFIEAGGYSDPSFWSLAGWEFVQSHSIVRPNYWDDPNWNGEDHPVTGVSWWEAMAYARFLGKTLPTEAQWEYAAKGPEQRRYPWGNEEKTLEYTNFAPMCEPIERKSTSVFAHPMNRSYFGCLDLAGNLAEWCLDNYSKDYTYDSNFYNPVLFEDEQSNHVVRGGCWLHNESYLRCTARDHYHPGLRDNLIGFRCAKNDIGGEES